MEEGLIKDRYELVIKEAQAFISFCYILMVGIGMLFNYQKFAAFGINIFDYADILDFLIAPFADYRIVIFAFLSTLIPWFLFRLDSIWRKKAARSYRIFSFGLVKFKWFDKSRLIAFGFLFLLYLYIGAKSYGENAKNRILEQDKISVEFVDNEIEKGIAIGKTKEMLFLYQNETVKIIPLTGLVKEIELNDKIKN